MKKAHALVVTSLWEDPGFVLVEAALSNLFIIAYPYLFKAQRTLY
jgi:hypothetical protein